LPLPETQGFGSSILPLATKLYEIKNVCKVLDLEILKLKFNLEIKNIAHVGANNGKEVKVYKKLFPNSEIHLFEPNKLSFEKIKNKYKNMENIFLYNFALGNENTEKVLYTSTDFPNTSSILEPNLLKVYYPKIILNDKEVVKLRNFDSLNIKGVNFMAIDTQGYELEVLKGAIKNINSMDHLIVEINRKHLYKNSPLQKDIDVYLKSLNFMRVVTSYWGKECVWGDAFYITKNRISNKLIYKTLVKNFAYKSILIYKTIRFLKNTIKNFKLNKLFSQVKG